MEPRSTRPAAAQPNHAGTDRAFANLLRLLRTYIEGGYCTDCEARLSATVCGQLHLLIASPSVGPGTREACLDLLDHWLLPPGQRRPDQREDAHG